MRKTTILPLSMLAILPFVGAGLVLQFDSLTETPTQWNRLHVVGDLPSTEPKIFANGLIEGSQRNVDLSFEVTGRLASIPVAEGCRVRKGETLARLAPVTWQLEVEKSKARLVQAQSELERLEQGARQETRDHALAKLKAAAARADMCRRKYDRTNKLAGDGVVEASQLDTDRGACEAAIAELAAAQAYADEVNAPARAHELQRAQAEIALVEAQLEHAVAMLEKTELKAPSNGVILQVHVEPGEMVGPDSATPIITMVDDSEYRVRAYVEELDALGVVPGQSASVAADSLGELQLPGTVISCAPGMVPKSHFGNRPEERVDVKVREIVIRIKNTKQIPPLVVGLPVDVYIGREVSETCSREVDGAILEVADDLAFETQARHDLSGS